MDKVTEVDLENINFNMVNKLPAIEWLYCQYGAQSEGLWKLKGLRYVYFKEPKHATHFILKWN